MRKGSHTRNGREEILTDKRDDRTEWTGVDSDVKLRKLGPFSSGEKERAWKSAMKVIRDLGEDPDEIVREASMTVAEDWRYHPYRQEERIRQLLEANTEEPERRRKAENKLENELVVHDALIARIRKQEKHRGREFFIGFMAGFFLAYALVEGLRWLFS